MKAKILLALTLIVFFTAATQAQMFGRANNVAMPKETVAKSSVSSSAAEKVTKSNQDILKRQQINAELDAMLAEEVPPTVMTAEQKAEIDSDARDDVHMSVRKQTVKDRKLFLGAMDSAARIQKRREVLVSGGDESAAAQAEAEVSRPKINTASDSDMEKFLFEKAQINIVKDKDRESTQSDKQ